jgi:hypothetical protein
VLYCLTFSDQTVVCEDPVSNAAAEAARFGQDAGELADPETGFLKPGRSAARTTVPAKPVAPTGRITK